MYERTDNSISEAGAETQLTRRGFLKSLAVAGGASFLGKGLLTRPDEAEAQDHPSTLEGATVPATSMHEALAMPQSSPQANIAAPRATAYPASAAEPKPAEHNGSYVDTALEGVGLMGANIVIIRGLEKTGLKIGNSRTTRTKMSRTEGEDAILKFAKMSRGETLKSILRVVITQPAIEESMFRFAPSYMANLLSARGNQWGLGIATSAAFASVHGLKNEDGDVVLPVPQFTLGLLTWWLQRNRGFSHAIVAHAANNAPYGLGVAASRKVCKDQARHILARRQLQQEIEALTELG